ncbi:biotin synthase [uncultured Methylibium sp.]|uniref:biotin synthase n=1 Tax=uncultured Methylibium sp. TaxID=381093 RepID=UPI0025DE2E40|nr:biotin synthase [uncultured Methylibium sp.]
MSDPAASAALHGAQPAAVQAQLRRAAQASEAPWLHREVARRMAERLAIIKASPDCVIDWGSLRGGGRAALQAQYPEARIEMVEPTPALAERSRLAARAPWWTPRRWLRPAPAAWLEPRAPRDGRAGLLWSNMTLHWAADPAPVFERWREAVAVGGFVMFSCFGPDTLRELRALYRRLGWGVPGHAFIDMHDLGDALVQAGFADPVMDMETLTLTWVDAEAALAELRGLGSNAAGARLAGCRTPRWRARLLDELQSALAGPDGRLRLSFEIVQGHAFQPPPRLRVAAETRVPVETLRRLARAGQRPPTT